MKVNGKLMKQIREEKGISVRMLASVADLSERRIQQIEGEEKGVALNLNIVKAIARKLGVDPAEISTTAAKAQA